MGGNDDDGFVRDSEVYVERERRVRELGDSEVVLLCSLCRDSLTLFTLIFPFSFFFWLKKS